MSRVQLEAMEAEAEHCVTHLRRAAEVARQQWAEKVDAELARQREQVLMFVVFHSEYICVQLLHRRRVLLQ